MSQIASTPAKLSDAQLVILSAAAQRADRSVLPFSQSLGAKGAALGKVIETLSRRKLVVERRVINGETEWRRDQEDRPLGLFITNGGLLALGLDESEKEEEPKAAASKTGQTKKPAARPRPKARKSPAPEAKKRGAQARTKQDAGDPHAAPAIRRQRRRHHRQDRLATAFRSRLLQRRGAEEA
jgi:hypothetical protein